MKPTTNGTSAVSAVRDRPPYHTLFEGAKAQPINFVKENSRKLSQKLVDFLMPSRSMFIRRNPLESESPNAQSAIHYLLSAICPARIRPGGSVAGGYLLFHSRLGRE
jgi:hypothetical protein